MRLRLVVVLSVVIIIAVYSSPYARTWHVPSECSTIRAGMDSASYGDTVLVAPGTYRIHDDPNTRIRAEDGVWLMSEEGPEVTVIEMCTATGIWISTCEGARVSGFGIRLGSGEDCEWFPTIVKAIYCYASTDVIVENCIIEGTQ